MSRPVVSIALPVRNAATTIGPALESLLAQSESRIEIVVVDHDSEDTTPEVVATLAERDARIRMVRCSGTFVEAANLAWRETSAPLVARMDGDDISHPGRIEIQRRFLEAHTDLAGCAGLVRILKREQDGGSGPPEGGYRRYEQWVNSVRSPEQIEAQRFIDSPLPNPTMMVRRSVLEEAGGYADPEWAEDYDLWLQLLGQDHRFGKVPEVVLDWYDAPGRSTRTLPRYEWSMFQKAKAHYLAQLPLARQRGVVIAGAGPTGKEFARFLGGEDGVEVVAFLEVNDRQIGNRIQGIPVRASGEIGDFAGRVVLLGAAGRPGARERIRDLAVGAGFFEGTDFFSVA